MALSFSQAICSCLDKSKGQLFAFTSGILIALNASFTKDLSQRNKVSSVITGRCLAQIVFCFLCIVITKGVLIPKEKSELAFFIVRCFANASLTILVAIAYSHLPILDTMAIYLYVSIIVKLVVARVKLKEKIDLFTSFVIFAMFGGIVMLCQPAFLFGTNVQEKPRGSNHAFGYLIASAGGIFQAISTLTIRVMPKTRSDTISLYGGITTLILALIYSTFDEGPRLTLRPQDYGFMVSAGFSYAAFVWTETLSLKILCIAKYEIFALIELPVCLLVDIIWFKDVPNMIGCLGAATIILSIVAKSGRDVYKFIAKQKEETESTRLVGDLDPKEQNVEEGK